MEGSLPKLRLSEFPYTITCLKRYKFIKLLQNVYRRFA